jgi:FKBP-type peptidyl-prolyl cis-trans isomerase FklB
VGLFSKLFGGESPHKAEGEAFLAENAQKAGVTVTASGLQYTLVKEGGAERPGATDSVTVHYEGKLLDGTVFDSSYTRNEPATFPLDAVIKGWTEGVQLMGPGAKFEFAIPYDLAYGERGSPPRIPSCAALLFTVELLAING